MLDLFLSKNTKYKIDRVGIQETTINYGNDSSKFYSLNEIVIRDKNLKKLREKIRLFTRKNKYYKI